MKNLLTTLFVVIKSIFIFAQKEGFENFVEKKIESGTTYLKQENGKLGDSIIVEMASMNFGNALVFHKTKDAINITSINDKDFLITIELKNKYQIRTCLYKNKPILVLENIDFDRNNLPKNAMVSRIFSHDLVSSYTVINKFEQLNDVNYDKIFKLFYRLDLRADLDNIDAIFSNIASFFSEEDALLRIYYGNYADKFTPQLIAYINTDDSGKILDGIILDFKDKKTTTKSKYDIYKDGKITKSGSETLESFQKIIEEYFNLSAK